MKCCRTLIAWLVTSIFFLAMPGVSLAGYDYIDLKMNENGEKVRLDNDLIFIFAGGELPTAFLRKIGLEITKKHGEALLKH